MPIQVGDRVPEATFKVKTASGIEDLTTAALFAGKKVVLFALPGAFTPTCSVKHLPGFVGHAADFKAKGVDSVACVSVNDAFVMGAWGADQGVGDDVVMLADGNADFSKALGLDFDASGFGMGVRCQRFAMIVEDGRVTTLNVEAPGAFEVSSAETMLAAL